MKRQRYNTKIKKWVVSEWENGNWKVLSQQDEKEPGVNVSKKPQFRG